MHIMLITRQNYLLKRWMRRWLLWRMSLPACEMKYIFEVEFEDGSLYLQNPDDISSFDKKRSCWFDIESEFLPHKKWKRLTLYSSDGIDHSIFSDGHFEVAGLPFRVHECDHPITNVQMIYHRRHWEQVSVNYDTKRVS